MEEEIGAAFDAIAGHYDDNDEHAHIADALVRLLVPAAAGFLVDVATGTGAAAFAALELLGPTRIVAVDISAGMLGVARKRAVTPDPGQRIEWLRAGGRAAFSVPTAASFSPSPQFRRLLPAAGIRLPASRDDAAQLLEGTGLQLQQAVELQSGDARRSAMLLVAGG